MLRRHRVSKVIGLCGHAGSGKSYCAGELEKLNFKLIKFAEPMKNMLRAYFSCCGLSDFDIDRRIEGDLKETPDDLLCGKTPRYAMQTLGTEWGRALIGESIWSDAWTTRAKEAVLSGQNVVTDDVRFDTEEAEVRKLDGIMIKVVRDDLSLLLDHDHSSELMEELTFDRVIVNDKTLEDLREVIVSVAGDEE